MWISCLFSTALAGGLVIDAQVPAEVYVGGLPIAQLYQPSLLRVALPDGPADVTVRINGQPQTLRMVFAPTGEQWLFIGRTGVSAETRATPEPDLATLGRVELRSGADEQLTIHVGPLRHRLPPGDTVILELPTGRHRLQVRNAAGTVIWAEGNLDVSGAGPVIVQLDDGRLPQIGGTGGVFHPDRK